MQHLATPIVDGHTFLLPPKHQHLSNSPRPGLLARPFCSPSSRCSLPLSLGFFSSTPSRKNSQEVMRARGKGSVLFFTWKPVSRSAFLKERYHEALVLAFHTARPLSSVGTHTVRGETEKMLGQLKQSWSTQGQPVCTQCADAISDKSKKSEFLGILALGTKGCFKWPTSLGLHHL